MADNDIGNLISNYGDMSIEELGGSLLQRQSDIAAAQAKEDKKNRKFQQAMGVLMAGQAIFKSAYNKREKELEARKIFQQSNNASQAKEINTISNVLSIMPETWHEDKPLEERVDLFMDSEYKGALEAKLRKPIDAVIEASSPYDFQAFKNDGVYYRQTFDNALKNTVTDYLKDNKYKKYEAELGELLGQPDRVEAIKKGMGLSEFELSKAERIYYDGLKEKYRSIGIVDSVKNIFSKIGLRQQKQGELNQFKDIDKQDLYGNEFDDSLANLNLRTTLITSVDKSFADFRKDTRRFSVEVRDPINEGLVIQADGNLNSFATRMKDRSIAKNDDFMNIAIGTTTGKMMARNRGTMYARYLDDLTESERQEMVNDIAGTALLLNEDTDLAENIYVSSLKEIGVDVTESKVKTFRSNMRDDTYRLNFATAIVSREGLKSSGVIARETYDFNGIMEEKIVSKYSYDRFSGEIPALLGDGIMTPKESNSNEFSVDDNWDSLNPEGQREVFDLHFNNIQKSRIKDSQKLILQENLFENVPHPDGYNFEEYVESRMPTRMQRIKEGVARGLLSPINKPGAIAQQVIGAFGKDVQGRSTKKLNNQIEKVNNLESNTSIDPKILEKEKEKLFKMQIKQSDNLIVKRLLDDEGYRTNVYEDSEGILTAGMGHKLTNEEKEIYKKGDYVPTDVVQKWTQNDINKFINITNEVMEDKGLLDSKLYKENEDMFVSFFYQLGKDGGLAFNNMWDAINRGDARAAHDEALDSLWAKQTPKRAKRFANMLLENV